MQQSWRYVVQLYTDGASDDMNSYWLTLSYLSIATPTVWPYPGPSVTPTRPATTVRLPVCCARERYAARAVRVLCARRGVGTA